MIEPIPFAGLVEIPDEVDDLLKQLAGTDSENMPKYMLLGDGSVYFYMKEEDKYALCEQAAPVQKGI